jgi:hypothetical protein
MDKSYFDFLDNLYLDKKLSDDLMRNKNFIFRIVHCTSICSVQRTVLNKIKHNTIKIVMSKIIKDTCVLNKSNKN